MEDSEETFLAQDKTASSVSSSGENSTFELSVEPGKEEPLIGFCKNDVRSVTRQISMIEEDETKEAISDKDRAQISPFDTTKSGDKTTPCDTKSANTVNDGVDKHWKLKSAIALALLYFIGRCIGYRTPVVIDDPDAIYVPGGGFSGFWFTLGRLSSIEDPLNKKYYCYSACCLGSVTMLSNITMEAAYEYAVGAQKRWQRGELSRYDVTESFINNLLYGSDKAEDIVPSNVRPSFRDARVLSTLRIITSERSNLFGLKVAVRTPKNVEELKDMLLQTAWIPFALSRDLWHQKHMDGAFTLFEHPQFRIHLGYGLDWDIMSNALNVNLGYDKVSLLWERGLAQGLQQ